MPHEASPIALAGPAPATHNQLYDRPQTEMVALETQVEEVYAKMREAGQHTDDLFNGYDEKTRRKISGVFEEIDAQVTAHEKNPNPNGQAAPDNRQLLAQHPDVPEDFKAGAILEETYAEEAMALEAELEKHAPEKAKAVLAQLLDFESRIDYPVLAEFLAHRDDTDTDSTASILFGARRDLESGTEVSYRYLRNLERELANTTKYWGNSSIVVDEPLPPYRAKTDEPLEPKLEALQKKYMDTTFNIVERKYHRGDAFSPEGQEASSILEFGRRLKAGSHDDGFAPEELTTAAPRYYNEQLQAAIKDQLAQRIVDLDFDRNFETDYDSQAYADMVVHDRLIDGAEAVAKMEITGDLSKLPFEFSATALREILQDYVPAVALAHVKRVEFRPLTKDEAESDTALGLHIPDRDGTGSTIIISDERVVEHYQERMRLMNAVKHQLVGDFKNPDDYDTDAKRIAEEFALEHMMETVAHEFGHAMHDAIPVAALRRWDEQISGDKTNITPYIKLNHDQNSRNRYIEDFAESFSMFTVRPDKLALISPARFEAMEEIFDDFMPDYDERLKPLQDEQIDQAEAERKKEHLTKEEARRILLAHEVGAVSMRADIAARDIVVD